MYRKRFHKNFHSVFVNRSWQSINFHFKTVSWYICKDPFDSLITIPIETPGAWKLLYYIYRKHTLKHCSWTRCLHLKPNRDIKVKAFLKVQSRKINQKTEVSKKHFTTLCQRNSFYHFYAETKIMKIFEISILRICGSYFFCVGHLSCGLL